MDDFKIGQKVCWNDEMLFTYGAIEEVGLNSCKVLILNEKLKGIYTLGVKKDLLHPWEYGIQQDKKYLQTVIENYQSHLNYVKLLEGEIKNGRF